MFWGPGLLLFHALFLDLMVFEYLNFPWEIRH